MNAPTRVAPAPPPTLLDVVNFGLRHRRTIAGGALAGAVLFMIVALIVPPTYVAHLSFIQAEPSRSALSGNLSAIASRFGVGAGTVPAASLDFLRQSVTSRDVLDSLLLHRLVVARPALDADPARVDTIDLADWLRIRGRTEAWRLERLRRRVLRSMEVSADQRSGIVQVDVRLRDPYVASALLRRLVDVLNLFNLHTRQTSSRANRIFLEGRVVEARAQLDSVEWRLRRFYEQNRRFNESPSLQFEEGRFKRQVDIAQQTFTTLSQDLEQARIEEVKDTPVLTVVETAQPPVQRASPKRTLLTLLGALVGATVSVLSLVWTRSARRAASASSPAWTEFIALAAGLPGGRRVARGLAGLASNAPDQGPHDRSPAP